MLFISFSGKIKQIKYQIQSPSHIFSGKCIANGHCRARFTAVLITLRFCWPCEVCLIKEAAEEHQVTCVHQGGPHDVLHCT
ncbi:hypothetical protein FKM82_015225 [Ascaphus truei]